MKQKKSKIKKPQNSTKKHGKQVDLGQLRSQLDALGLKIIQVTADGNCFFRALADQLEGNEEEHKKYRGMVVQYILNHRQDFEPFIEDDVPFDEYCQSMEKDGTWAGNMELQAASLVTRRNICIHQANSPRWYINNFSSRETSVIHLSYHDGEHYNSVRLAEDSCEGPARPIPIKSDDTISAVDNNKKAATHGLKVSSRKNVFDSGAAKLVMAGTGCTSIKKVEEVLREVDGDVDAAIEFLIAEQQADEKIEKDDGIPPGVTIGLRLPVEDQNANCERAESTPLDMASELDRFRRDFLSAQCDNDDQEVASSKGCSCGSKKKHKACCGSTVGKSSETYVKKNHVSRKGKKEVKRTEKKEATRGMRKCQSETIPDVGALCI